MIKTLKDLIFNMYLNDGEIKLYRSKEKYYFISIGSMSFNTTKKLAKIISKLLYIHIGEWGKDE